MKKYFLTLIIGLIVLLFGIIVLLFEIVNYDDDKEYYQFNAVKEYNYNLNKKYIVANNMSSDNIKIYYNNTLENKMIIKVSYNKDLVSLKAVLNTKEDKEILNIYSEKQDVNIIDSINNLYNITKNSIRDKAIYNYSDLYKIRLDIYINESEVDKIINYTSIIANEK